MAVSLVQLETCDATAPQELALDDNWQRRLLSRRASKGHGLVVRSRDPWMTVPLRSSVRSPANFLA